MSELAGTCDLKRPIRVLAVARVPWRADDLGADAQPELELVRVVRRLGPLVELVEELEPDVVLVDTSFPERHSFEAIAEIRQFAPDVRILALTPDPPPHEDVVRAVRAGALGFVDSNAEPGEYLDAIRSANAGEQWLPSEQTRAVFRDVADDLEVTARDRRSRLTAVVLGLIPAVGILAGVISLLWRKYLAQIGVRPVDIAVDPGTRVVDMVIAVLFVCGSVGPFLFIGTWTDMIRDRASEHTRAAWLAARPWLLRVALFFGVLAVLVVFWWLADLAVALFLGPAVLVALLAVVLDLASELPPFLRLSRVRARRVVAGTIAAIAVVTAALSVEVFARGPEFSTKGVDGAVPKVLGFRVQPVYVIDVDGKRDPRELLYLGGNADLYVLVDPCNEDAVEMVSVGSSRLEVIDEVTCAREPS